MKKNQLTVKHVFVSVKVKFPLNGTFLYQNIVYDGRITRNQPQHLEKFIFVFRKLTLNFTPTTQNDYIIKILERT